MLKYLPKLVQPKARQASQEIWMAAAREDTHGAFDLFAVTYGTKSPKATECLKKDRDALLAFYDFPAEHWPHIRTSNPIESSFATIRYRTDRTQGCGSRLTLLTMMFKLGLCAEKRWRRIRGFHYLAKVITGVRFKDGIEEIEDSLENSKSAA